MPARQHTILEEIQPIKRAENPHTSVTEVLCYVCGKGFESESVNTITAKTFSNRTDWFCDTHYPLD